jgi:hypothetical protein
MDPDAKHPPRCVSWRRWGPSAGVPARGGAASPQTGCSVAPHSNAAAHPKPPPPPPPPSAGYPVERMDLPPGWAMGEAD